MKIALYHRPELPHQLHAMKQLRAGLMKCGEQCKIFEYGDRVPSVDLHVVWSKKRMDFIQGDYMILEAGYINGNTGDYHKDRNRFVSFTINGMHNDAPAHLPAPGTDRWDALGIEMLDWKLWGDYSLVLGQHPQDAVTGPAYEAWLITLLAFMSDNKMSHRFRPHPSVGSSAYSLAEDLERAYCAITYCSTAAVEAVIAGVPTLTFNESSMAWDVTSHHLEDPVYREDRTEWAANLAYRQWSHKELRDGSAWEWMKLNYDYIKHQ